MGDHGPSPIDYGFRGPSSWVISGAISGVTGAIAFGAFFGFIYPDVVSVTIPSLYGLEATRSTGWALHLFHGLVLGVVFGFFATREWVLRRFIVNSRFFEWGPSTRLTIGGVLYGLLVWLSIPLVAVPLWSAVTGNVEPDFPYATVESLIGHLIFGGVLGFVFANFINASVSTE